MGKKVHFQLSEIISQASSVANASVLNFSSAEVLEHLQLLSALLFPTPASDPDISVLLECRVGSRNKQDKC